MSPKHNPLENIAAEQMVLGKILQSESAFWSVADVLSAFHFVRPIHQTIFQTVRDTLTEGKRLSIALLESRIGPQYDDDGKSTVSLLTALLRDAENNENALDEVDVIVDLWRHRMIIQTLEQGLKDAKKPGTISTDLLANLEIKLDDIGTNSQSIPLKSLGEIAASAAKKSRTAQKTGTMPGFDTGLPSLDALIGRIHPGDVGAIGAKPGDGKTVVGAQLALRASLFGPSLFFQLEMQAEDMARRYLADRANMSVAEIEEGQYNFEDAENLQAAVDQLRNAKVYIDDRPKLALERIHDRALQLKRSKGLICIVVDHLRHVRVFGKVRDKFERMEVVTGGLKSIAKELGVAVILLSQVTRASQRRDDPVPQLADLDGGGSLDQDADWAVALFRRDRWLKSQRPEDMESKDGREWAEQMVRHKGRIEVHSLKGRRREDGEMRDFWFDGRRSVIREIER
ncbi:replicative DNA helicase [Mesorhizobium sp. L-8-10]|uniref:replicative DNA helicase n=1 Tax=Mesorhizobium sp. L-8-10 TaxID=2744523 RepID=UPI001926FE9C|nr:DnaB-like helicase C-terminal domain-containing protein [Mesorhizobium sp. L-8-10]BCH33214.1 replicative DNA helicase [Mesorhizobium sp. L-8-10]